ncbi:MAG TPA: hypothetical protein DCS31_06705 [Candidatus Competibacteraceae bacterium]|nr:hypothetical protein [Candidatus Competibacteraceae bacterium]
MPRYRYPRLRWFGRILGLLYLLVTALFGPIKSLARWLAGQKTVQRYQRGVANLPPSAAPVSYTHLRANQTVLDLVCPLLL